MENPEFDHMVSYTPEREFSDRERKTRQFDEMWTDDWWWEMQVSTSVNKSGKKYTNAFSTEKIAPRGHCHSSYPRIQ
jgi:hypothetical protein